MNLFTDPRWGEALARLPIISAATFASARPR
jgi:hypothetical protein